MKAHVQKERPLALLYHLPCTDDNGRNVQDILKKMGIPTQEVPEADLSQTLGACAGIPGFQRTSEIQEQWEIPEGEAVIMAGFTNQQLDTFLARLRQENAKVRFKAVLTPHNRNWPFGKLLGELNQEERLLKRMAPLRDHVRRAKQFLLDGSLQKGPELDAALRRAQALIEGKEEITEDALSSADEVLLQAMNQMHS